MKRILLLGAALAFAAGADDLRVYSDAERPRASIYEFLNGVAQKQLAERRAAVSRLRTPDEVRARAARTRETFLRMIGGLPATRTPLNLQRTGSLDRGDYRVEMVLFESLPGFYVTGNLYIPSGQGPFPAVLHPTGHSATAKTRGLYQSLSIGLAKSGFVVLTYDPLGQGERRIFWDQHLQDSKVGGTTVEHQMVGVQSLLAGESMARLMVWDGIRGIDLLSSLPYVDARRIGVTGCSGGGTLTTYLAVADERVQVAAPSCYITSWEDQLPGTGPQDAEQQFPDQLLEGIDHGDLVQVFAPKPYLICSTTEDFFPLSGAKKTYEEAKRVWGLFGGDSGEKIAWFYGPGGHGMRADTRSAIYAWMNRWLRDRPGEAPEPKFDVEYEENLHVTASGQVTVSFGGETASTLNMSRYRQIQPEGGDLKAHVLRLTRYQASSAPLAITERGTAGGAGYRVQKLLYDAEPGRKVPALLYLPANDQRRTVLYAGESGKDGDDPKRLAELGYTVLAIDLAGMGETLAPRTSYSVQWFGQDKPTWLALMVGRTLTGIRMADFVRGLDVLAARGLLHGGKAQGVAHGSGPATALLHAALLDERFGEIRLEEALVSYRAVATTPVHRQIFDSVLPNVLRAYDLPDLARALAPRKVTLVNTATPLGATLAMPLVRASYPDAHIDVRRRREAEPIL
ncbi:MAG: acetylxylan esterase [Bryobacterales bacterium]|nr:acetylxylan esterase [Bryobacterales bacterium]